MPTINSRLKEVITRYQLGIKFKFAIFSLFFVLGANAQSLQERLLPLVCDCFESNFNPESPSADLIAKCFDISSGKKLKEFEDYLAKEVDTVEIKNTYGDGYDYGMELASNFFSDIQEPLVNKCEAYYNYLLAMSNYMMDNMTKGTNKQRADSLRLAIESCQNDPNVVWEVGAFDLGRGNTDKAKEYFLKGTKIDSLHVPSNLFLGIVHDLEGDYQMAIDRYEKVEKGELQHLVVIAQMYRALSKRKLKEKRN